MQQQSFVIDVALQMEFDVVAEKLLQRMVS
jgi:hypothetical protein